MTSNIRTCLVQLGRYGDILNLLPVAHAIAKEEGGKVAMLVHRDFIDLLEGVSYVKAIQWDGNADHPREAAEFIKGKFERVIQAQVNDSSHARQRICEAFNMDQWHYCGFLDRWTDPAMQLVIDRRSPERENKLMESLRLRGRPYILVNVRGVSGKFHAEDQLLTEIHAHFATEAQIVDMRRFRAAKLFDLLGLIDNAICMVTVDTATVHLAAASQTPVIALLRDYNVGAQGRFIDLWCGPKLRGGNIVLSMRYQEYEHRRNEITVAIKRVLTERKAVHSGRLRLPAVTIIGVDNFTPARTLSALWFASKMVQVPEVLLVCRPGNQLPGGDMKGVKIKPIIKGASRPDRENFLVRDLHHTFETSHCLHIEWDARIANPAAWQDSWLQYDYIGAPWPWPFEQIRVPWLPDLPLPRCEEHNCVGNLGFALISKRFAKAVAEITDPNDPMSAASDIYICRTLRPKLEQMGIQFAPEKVAAAFSCEGRFYSGQFGFHGVCTFKLNGFQL